jgi:hypothetical protein
VTVDVSGELIRDGEAELRVLDMPADLIPAGTCSATSSPA